MIFLPREVIGQQIIELDDGTQVRYFTEEQLAELANELIDYDRCLSTEEINNQMILELNNQLVLHQENIVILNDTVDSLSLRLNQSMIEIDEADDFLFCDNVSCILATSFVAGSIVTLLLLNM